MAHVTRKDNDNGDYPNLAHTPTSLNRSEKNEEIVERLAHAEVKMKRLVKQMQEMNLEYKCQKT